MIIVPVIFIIENKSIVILYFDDMFLNPTHCEK